MNTIHTAAAGTASTATTNATHSGSMTDDREDGMSAIYDDGRYIDPVKAEQWRQEWEAKQQQEDTPF